jgi:uncharacterized repeat protein (TIGR01451 family)
MGRGRRSRRISILAGIAVLAVVFSSGGALAELDPPVTTDAPTTTTAAPPDSTTTTTTTAPPGDDAADPGASGPTSAAATPGGGTGGESPEGSGSGPVIAAVDDADLGVTKDAPASPVAGTDVSYSITVTNNGPADAAPVTLTDPVPTSTTFVNGVGGSGVVCGETGGVVTCTWPGITSGTTATATTTVQAPPPQSADLSVTKTDSPDPVTAGSNLTYTITVTNSGPADADIAQITDSVPAGTSFVSVLPTVGSCLGTATFTCDLGPLANGASATITLVVLVDPGATPGTVISNTASLGLPSRAVSAASVDPNAGNDSATASTTVVAADTPGEVPGSPGGAPGSPAAPGGPTLPGGSGVPATAGVGVAATAAVAVVANPTFKG